MTRRARFTCGVLGRWRIFSPVVNVHLRCVRWLLTRADAHKPPLPFDADCQRCANEAADALPEGDINRFCFRMYLCPECGDKRCAKAQDHRAACSPPRRLCEMCEGGGCDDCDFNGVDYFAHRKAQR